MECSAFTFRLINIILLLGAAVLTLHESKLVSQNIKIPLSLFAGVAEHVRLKDIQTVLVFMGLALLVTVFIGFFGIAKESEVLLKTYGILMGLQAVINLSVGIYLLTQTGATKRTVSLFVRNAFHDPELHVFHVIEARFKCCGTFGPNFYVTHDGVDYVAPSCCHSGVHCNKRSAFQRGCVPVLREGIELESTTWAYILVGAAICQFVAAGIGLYFAGFESYSFWWY